MDLASEDPEELRQKYPPIRISESGVLASAWDLGIPEADLNALLQFDRAKLLLNEMVPALPLLLRSMIEEGRVHVFELGLSAPNAHVWPVSSDEYAITLNSGLFEFLYRIARPLSAASVRIEGDVAEMLSPSELARVISEIFWWQKATGISYGPSYPVSKGQLAAANLLATEAEKFLLGHELGHVYASQTAEWKLSDLNASEEAALEEHVADLMGMHATLNQIVSRADVDPMRVAFSYAGVEFALQIWRIMEILDTNFVDGVHPPTGERIEQLRKMLRLSCPSDATFATLLSIAKVNELLFEKIAEIIKDPGEHKKASDDRCEKLLNDFDELFSRCSADVIPDYLTFYSEAPALLSVGYPTDILQNVVDRIGSNFASIIAAGNPRDSERSDRKGFNSFKLLFGLADKLPEPVGQIYRTVLFGGFE